MADHGDLLRMAPKTITHKIHRLHLPHANEVIKNGFVLEAKCLLVHASLTAKEIASEIGYSEPAFFGGLFMANWQIAVGLPGGIFG